jgi:hypothetical protein
VEGSVGLVGFIGMEVQKLKYENYEEKGAYLHAGATDTPKAPEPRNGHKDGLKLRCENVKLFLREP